LNSRNFHKIRKNLLKKEKWRLSNKTKQKGARNSRGDKTIINHSRGNNTTKNPKKLQISTVFK
jgi:hypothetical protein